MRTAVAKTLTAIALGIGLVVGAGVAWSGPAGDQRGDTAERLARMTKQFNLTPEQQARIRTLLEEYRAAADRERTALRQRIDAVLTDAQRAERDARIQQRVDRQLDRMSRRLQLSADQTAQVRAVFVDRQANPEMSRAQFKERIKAVLTPVQLKQLEAMEQRGAGQGGKGRGPVEGSPDNAAAAGAGPSR